jgi:hypothetical protein
MFAVRVHGSHRKRIGKVGANVRSPTKEKRYSQKNCTPALIGEGKRADPVLASLVILDEGSGCALN